MNLEWIWNGYLLATNQQGHIMDKRFSSSAPPESRLTELYLRDARIDNGETLQSFWLGCTLTAFSSSSLADIMTNVGWSNPNTGSYYLKLEDIIRAGALSDRLASNLFTVDGVWFPLRLGLWLLLRMGVLHGVLC